MATEKIMNMGKQSLSILEEALNKKPESIISVSKEGEEWKILAEVLERRAVPNTQDILGRYDIRLDGKGELLGYKQVMTKRRADLIAEEE